MTRLFVSGTHFFWLQSRSRLLCCQRPGLHCECDLSYAVSLLVVLATDWHRTESSKCMMIYSGYLAVESIWTMFHPYLTTVKWTWHARHHLQQSWEIFRCDTISNPHKTGDRYEYDYFPPFWISSDEYIYQMKLSIIWYFYAVPTTGSMKII